MADYILTNGELKRTDELKHWKYIKKVKKNGKWRYYYDNDELKSSKSAYEKAESDHTTAQLRYAAAEATLAGNRASYMEDGKITDREQAELAKMQIAVDHHKLEYKRAGENYVSSKKKYMKTKLKNVVPEVIGKGVAAVKNVLSNLFGKKKKKKSKLTTRVSIGGPRSK